MWLKLILANSNILEVIVNASPSFEVPNKPYNLMFDKKENLSQTLCSNNVSCKLLNMYPCGNALW